MILLTKNFFLQVKILTHASINLFHNDFRRGEEIVHQETWQICMQGISVHNDEQMSVYANFSSKEEAYESFNDLMKQVVDSGELSELTNRLFHEVIVKKE
jgi:hypothetical protein